MTLTPLHKTGQLGIYFPTVPLVLQHSGQLAPGHQVPVYSVDLSQVSYPRKQHQRQSIGHQTHNPLINREMP